MTMPLRARIYFFIDGHFLGLIFGMFAVVAAFALVFTCHDILNQRKERLFTNIQVVCDKKVPNSKAAIIVNLPYCETSPGLYQPIDMECGNDDPFCATATRACRKMGLKKAIRGSDIFIICEAKDGRQFHIRL